MRSNLFVCCLCFFLFNSPLAFSNDLRNLKSRLNLLHNFESVLKDLKSLQCRQTFGFITIPERKKPVVIMGQDFLNPAMSVNQEDVLEPKSQNFVIEGTQGKAWARVLRLEEELKEWEAREVQGKLGREELKIPQGSRESEILKAQGFEEEHIRGIDEMSETITVSKQFRERNVKPDMHMDYFGDKMEDRIQFMEKGVRNPVQKRMLKLLREYGEKAIETESVSYEKWILFNIMLVEALGNDRFKIGQSIRDHVHDFPRIVFLPTIEGIVGFITMNDGIDKNVYVLGQTNQEVTEYDGVKGDPLFVMDHDTNHIRRIIDGETRTNYSFHRKMKKVRKQIKRLPAEQRKSLEIAYWLLRYEKPDTWGHPSRVEEEIRSGLRVYYYRKKIEKSDQEIQKTVDAFMEVYTP